MCSRGFVGLALALPLAACGGGNNPVASPPVTVEVHPVGVMVFYDENGNGRLDGGEAVRIPGATVTIGARSATTSGPTGQAMITGVPAGPRTLTVSGLPPFYVAPPGLPVDVPPSAEVLVPVTLPIGGNEPNLYMAYGDSITLGDGSRGDGYPTPLQDMLRLHYGAGEVLVEGFDGGQSSLGAQKIAGALQRRRPAFTLIHFGTNDWNGCNRVEGCGTVDSLTSIVEQVKAAGSLPVLATIIPVNEGYSNTVPPIRNEFVAEQDRRIRQICVQTGALLADIEPAFYKAYGGDLRPLFTDHVHPNDRGYQIMAEEFFKALTGTATKPAGTSRVLRQVFQHF